MKGEVHLVHLNISGSRRRERLGIGSLTGYGSVNPMK